MEHGSKEKVSYHALYTHTHTHSIRKTVLLSSAVPVLKLHDGTLVVKSNNFYNVSDAISVTREIYR